MAAGEDFSGWTSEVEIDQIRPGFTDGHLGGPGQRLGVFAEKLDAERLFERRVGGQEL